MTTQVNVQLLLMRHGLREQRGGECAPLTSGGRWQADSLYWLDRTSLRPQAILCSASRHATEHAEILSGVLTRKVPVVQVTALTPHTDEADFTVRGLIEEAGRAIDWNQVTTVACIGHEPRLQQLAQKMTGVEQERLSFGEFLVVEADSWQALDAGHGRVGSRNPPREAPGDATDLRDKVQSKMQTSALLAGFTATVFGVVLTQSDYWAMWGTGSKWPAGADRWRAAAVALALLSLALATLLFVVSIYMYDRLAMPQRYWDTHGGPPAQDRWSGFKNDRVRHGLVYAYMIWIWRFVFSVAVGMTLLGFFALVLHRGVWPIALLYLGVTALVVSYYRKFRPDLGVD